MTAIAITVKKIIVYDTMEGRGLEIKNINESCLGAQRSHKIDIVHL